jgi:hypothetical protein
VATGDAVDGFDAIGDEAGAAGGEGLPGPGKESPPGREAVLLAGSALRDALPLAALRAPAKSRAPLSLAPSGGAAFAEADTLAKGDALAEGDALAGGGGFAGGSRLTTGATNAGSVAFISGTLASDVPNPAACSLRPRMCGRSGRSRRRQLFAQETLDLVQQRCPVLLLTERVIGVGSDDQAMWFARARQRRIHGFGLGERHLRVPPTVQRQ